MSLIKRARDLKPIVFRNRLYAVFFCLLASCYIPSSTGYQGPSTLPDVTGRAGKVHAKHRPNKYQIKVLPTFELTMNREVAEHHRILSTQKKTFTEAYARRELYLPVLRQILRDEGVPEEILSLALIESGFRKEAKSPSGAVGIWQFIKGTAQSYGLKVSFMEDQRKDPVLSTIAAARMLRDLYEKFDDWPLAMAAYNCGPARVDRIIRETGIRDYWELSRRGYLPPETRKFVPRIIAVALIEREGIFKTV